MTPFLPHSRAVDVTHSNATRLAVYVAVGTAALYAFLALAVLEPESLFSIDAAIKLLQAQSLRDSGFTSVALAYPAHDLDPERRFVPFAPPLVFVQNGALQGVYPTSVALLNALALSVGFPGVVLLSVASALVVLLALARHARGAVPAVLLLGAGTPFWAYGVLPWEHMPALACSTVAVVLLERRLAGATFGAAALLGVAITLRGESALLLPGLAILYFRGVGWQRRAGAAVSVVGPLVAMAVIDMLVFGRPAFSHVLHAVDLLWTWFGGGVVALRPEHVPLWVRAETIVGYWIFGLPNGIVLGAAAAALSLVAARQSRAWRLQLILIVMVGAIVLLVHDLLTFVVAPDFVAGLLRVSPVLLFAVLPLGTRTPVLTARRAEQLLLLLFICGLLISSRHAGAQVGPRFMLPIFPLLAKMAWEGVQSYRRDGEADPAERIVGFLGIGLLAGSVAMQALVAIPALVNLNLRQRPIAQSLRDATPPFVVLSDQYLINHVGTRYAHTKVMMATSQSDADELSRRLAGAQANLAVGFVHERANSVRLSGFVITGQVHTPHASLDWLAGPGQAGQ